MVKRIRSNFGSSKNENLYFVSYVDLYVESEIYKINYTRYLKKYTHVYDKFKDDSDPTKDLSKVNDKVILPSTLEEWIQIYKELQEK